MEQTAFDSAGGELHFEILKSSKFLNKKIGFGGENFEILGIFVKPPVPTLLNGFSWDKRQTACNDMGFHSICILKADQNS